jgi:type II secretory pathway pseudopilin PulG
MSLIKIARNKANTSSLKTAFTNEDGAIDLASIMVGIIVIGLIGGVIAATVFAVIPWAQDNAAKQQLDSVASAESAYIGLSANDATGNGQQQSFASLTNNQISAADGTVLFDATGLNNGTTPQLSIRATGTGNSTHYGAAIRSASGKIYYISDGKTQPTISTITATGNAATAVADVTPAN